MAFSFLNPWFCLGALALLGPAWLHLHRRKEKNLVRFSAVRFLSAQPPAPRRPMRFRHRMLLSLRGLAVLLIVFAFAWPYLRKLNQQSISRSTVYILDNSLSRQTGDGLARDKERIIRDLRSAGPGNRNAVLELAGDTRLVVPFGTDRDTAIDSVRQLKPSFARGSYLNAFREANTLLAEVPGGVRQIVLLGDNQANQWQENAAAPPFLDHVQVEIPSASTQQLPNLWLYDGRAQRVYQGDKSRVNFTLRLGHLGPAEKAKVSLFTNGRPVLERTVDLRGQPQSMLLQGQCEADAASWVNAEAVVEGKPDALEPDNHFFFAVAPVLEGKVALLARSVFLNAALSPEVMRGHWRRQVLDIADRSVVGAVPDADVLCIESSYLQSPEARSLLQRYLEARLGVVLFVDRLSPYIDSNLRTLGFEPEGTVTTAQSTPEHFRFVTANHPIFEPFESSEFGILTEITVSHYAKLRPTAGSPLVFSDSGNGLVFESSKYPGKLFICAFGIDREQTSWPVHPTFVPFLDLALQAARPQEKVRTSFEPGETATVAIPLDSDAQTVSVLGNGGELSNAKVINGHASLRLPDQPGVFSLVLGQSGKPWQFVTVNPAPQESELLYVKSMKPLREWSITSSGHHRPQAVGPLPDSGYSNTLAQPLWWWMLMLGLMGLVLETAWVIIKGEKI
jgi:hypothetical protein